MAFLSQALSKAKQSLSIYDKEIFAFVIALHKWSPSLLGSRFKVRIDHHSLKFLLERRVGTPSQQRWLAKLLGYEFDVEYQSGASNGAVNALSRFLECLYLIQILPTWLDYIQKKHHDSLDIQHKMQALAAR